jgi:hypothetical protein
MFAKMPEGFNNPNSPDFPGLNSNEGPNIYNQYNTFENINSTSDYQNNANKNIQTNNITPEYPDPNLINKATENTKSSFLDNIMCNMSFLQSYFDIETDDIIKRLLASLIPCNKNFINIVEKKPDLYGPFWIYTTLILTIASCGSLTRFFKGTKINDNKNENFFQEFIPIAASIIYIIGFGLPILLTFLMKAFGSSINFVNVICTYGYSFSVFLPAVIFCVSNVNILQWIVLSYACFSSTSLLVVNYWKELQNFDSTKKYIICGVVLVIQIRLFILIKMCFFRILSDEIQGN